MQGVGFAVVAVPLRAAWAIRRWLRPPPIVLGDSHMVISERTYTVVERRLDCDGSCREPGVMPQSVIEWSGLPPELRMSFDSELGRERERYLATVREVGP